MSSRARLLFECVADQLSVHDVGPAAFQAAHGFVVIFAFGSFPQVVAPAGGIVADLGDGHDVQAEIELAIASAGKPVAHYLAVVSTFRTACVLAGQLGLARSGCAAPRRQIAGQGLRWRPAGVPPHRIRLPRWLTRVMPAPMGHRFRRLNSAPGRREVRPGDSLTSRHVRLVIDCFRNRRGPQAARSPRRVGVTKLGSSLL